MSGTVLLDAARGSYAGGPARISDVLGRHRPGLRRTWVLSDHAVTSPVVLPAGVTGVRRGSAAHLARLAAADVLVADDVGRHRLLPRRGTVYVQTWRGTPVTLLGFDAPAWALAADGLDVRALRRDVRRWDFLVSPSPVATELLRSAFRYDGEVLELGYPRDDALRLDTDGAVRRRVRAELGAGDSCVVLHVPARRDDGRPLWADPEHAALLAALPDDVELWVLGHPRDPAVPPHPRVRDVSAWPDGAELFLGADALLTDYSPATVDFAVTRKPIVHFVPDLERHVARRGLYVDYESWAPGPVTRTGADAAEALKQLAVDVARYDRFVRTYCPDDDGRSGERLLEALADVLPRG